MVSAFEMETLRMLKARKMLEQGVSLWEKCEGVYYVNSQSIPGKTYLVTHIKGEWCCDCQDYVHHHVMCKHMWLVILFFEKQANENGAKIINPIDNVECPTCHSLNIKKDGMRHNKYGNLQRYKCLDCGKRFSINIGFERMKHNPRFVTIAMQLYFSGESLRNTQKSLKLVGADVSHQTISNWIEKYITLMKAYCDNLKPKVSNTWRADEVWIRVKGDMKYLFALIDDETRYLIAQ